MNEQEFILNDDDFDVVTKDGLILAFFGDPLENVSQKEWQIIENTAGILGDQIRIGRSNVEESPVLAERLGIKSIPTTLVIKDGIEKDRIVGLWHEKALIKHIEKYLETK